MSQNSKNFEIVSSYCNKAKLKTDLTDEEKMEIQEKFGEFWRQMPKIIPELQYASAKKISSKMD